MTVGSRETLLGGNAGSGGLAQDISEENNITNWARDKSCNTLVKNMTVFCHCFKSFPEAKLGSNRLIPLAEVILRQHNIESVV